ncbi:MAG: 50S ribosomal protein L4 [Nanoarchaeota archaeon]|nr:50S ribosomal protein L4 [Nanoarchaeota archaeon]
MTKAKILTIEGKPGKEIELPHYFGEKIREDIVQKFFETSKKQHPYGPNPLSGKTHAASGKLSHQRHKWKTTYGFGISRVPRKIFWRRGTRFYWVGAFIASARGGRAAHAPKIEHFFTKKKINKKEILIALKSAISATSSQELITKRYSSIEDTKNINFPLIVEDKILNLKTKEFYLALQKILGDLNKLALQKKQVRPGKGKLRGRKYKQNAGLLMIIGEKENLKIQGITIRKISEIQINDLFPLGRLTLYTENAINELNKIRESDKEDKK